MKKLIFLITLLVTTLISAQVVNYPAILSKNSTTTPLSGNAKFTGTADRIMLYNNGSLNTTICVTIRSNQSGVFIIQQSLDGLTWDHTKSFTYTANDTTNNVYKDEMFLPIYRVIYTNGSAAQTTFRLNTTLLLNPPSSLDAGGNLKTINQLATTGGGYLKTTSVGGDSLAATETSWWRVTIRAVDDTVQFSKSSSYPSTDKNILYPGQSYTTVPLDAVLYPKFYFKTYGVGTPNVQLKHEGK